MPRPRKAETIRFQATTKFPPSERPLNARCTPSRDRTSARRAGWRPSVRRRRGHRCRSAPAPAGRRHPPVGRPNYAAISRRRYPWVRAAAPAPARHRVPSAARRCETVPCLIMPGVRGTGLASDVRHEEDVEVREMIGSILRRMREIGGENPVRRDLGRHRIAKSGSRGDRLRDRADAADPRRQRQRLEGRTPLQDLLEAAIQRRRHSARMTRPLSTSRPTSRSPSTR